MTRKIDVGEYPIQRKTRISIKVKHSVSFTRSELRLDGGGVIGDRARFSVIGGRGGGSGGTTFFGIFFKLLIETVEAVLFEGGRLGDDSRLIFTLDGDFMTGVVCSTLIGIFCIGLFVGICMGFFDGICGALVAFDGDGTGSFFFVAMMIGFMSFSAFNFVVDGRDFDMDGSRRREMEQIRKRNCLYLQKIHLLS